MNISFTQELLALERAINRLEDAVVRQQRKSTNNFESNVLHDLRSSCERLTDEKLRFNTIVDEAKRGHFAILELPKGGCSPTP